MVNTPATKTEFFLKSRLLRLNFFESGASVVFPLSAAIGATSENDCGCSEWARKTIVLLENIPIADPLQDFVGDQSSRRSTILCICCCIDAVTSTLA